jgi:hypothetical protein
MGRLAALPGRWPGLGGKGDLFPILHGWHNLRLFKGFTELLQSGLSVPGKNAPSPGKVPAPTGARNQLKWMIFRNKPEFGPPLARRKSKTARIPRLIKKDQRVFKTMRKENVDDEK